MRYGIVGAGFITRFQLRALEQVRGVEVAGLVSRRPPEALAAEVRRRGLGEGRVYGSIREMLPAVDVVMLNLPNFARVEAMEEIAVAAAQCGVAPRGLICEKPLARNLREGRRMVELAEALGAPTAYFENQVHMKAVKAQAAQLAAVMRAQGAPLLARCSEEHAGPHEPWFWDPRRQGGGALSDMGCHCIAVGRALLTPPGMPPRHLVPASVNASALLLKWGLPGGRDELRRRFGVDYAEAPAEDFASGIVDWRDPDTGRRALGQFSSSWMYDKQGLRIQLEALGAGYAFDFDSLRTSLEVFVADAAADSVADAESAVEKATAARGLLAVQPNEADLYGYTDENEDAARAFAEGRSALLDWQYGLEILQVVMAAYLSAEEGRRVDLTDAELLSRLEEYVPLIQQGRGAETLLGRALG